MSAIANNPVSPLLQPNLTRNAPRGIQQHPMSAIGPIDLNELRGLSGVTKFFVVIAVPGGESGFAVSQSPESDFVAGSPEYFNVLETLKRTAMQANDSHSDSNAAIGDVKVNFATMEAYRRGEPLSLTALEFKTLKYMIANARRVISRDELLNEVWGYENYPSTRTVDNQMSKLRKKLEEDPARPVHLRTVHGVGYKFLP
jgi:hypothetical protein